MTLREGFARWKAVCDDENVSYAYSNVMKALLAYQIALRKAEGQLWRVNGHMDAAKQLIEEIEADAELTSYLARG